MVTRAERYAEGKFVNLPHPKDRYPLPECTDPRAKKQTIWFNVQNELAIS